MRPQLASRRFLSCFAVKHDSFQGPSPSNSIAMEIAYQTEMIIIDVFVLNLSNQNRPIKCSSVPHTEKLERRYVFIRWPMSLDFKWYFQIFTPIIRINMTNESNFPGFLPKNFRWLLLHKLIKRHKVLKIWSKKYLLFENWHFCVFDVSSTL